MRCHSRSIIQQAEHSKSRPPVWRNLMTLAWVAVALSLSACASRKAPDPKPGGPKRVVVDKTVQKLFAYEGKRIVIESRVSTGRQGRRTPSGNFRAGDKEAMHYSSLYQNAPMPWSVQVNGNYFIHGYTSVPDYPASHGCIRMPLDGDNPAKRFYDWVEAGTPITITGEWAGQPVKVAKPR